MRSGELLIDHATPVDTLFPTDKGRGLIPRDYHAHPLGSYPSGMQAVDMPLIPRNEWSARIKEMVDTQSRLSDIRFATPGFASLNQGQVGYCWTHSGTHGVMYLRAVAGLPYVPLSAYAVAATIKGGRDEGGWGAQGLDFITARGVPSQALWPQGSRDVSRGTAACWANAALHKVSEGWIDLDAAQYDRDLTFDQVMTCLLSRVPVVCDYNFWGHSVLAIDPVEVEPGSFGVRIQNSWGDEWGDRGMGVLRGSQAVPDGAVAPRVTDASTS